MVAKRRSTKEEVMMEEAMELPPVPLRRIWRLQQRDWPWFVAGLLASCGAGASRPVFSIIYSGIITSYFSPSVDDMRSQASPVSFAPDPPPPQHKGPEKCSLCRWRL